MNVKLNGGSINSLFIPSFKKLSSVGELQAHGSVRSIMDNYFLHLTAVH